VKYLYTHSEFKDLILEIARKRNLPEVIVEKDYWVTFLLRSLVNSEFYKEIVFKGGTCLSKAWNLINRFSEDIDLLLIETENTKSRTQKSKRVKAIREFIKTLPNWNLIKDERSDLYGSFRYSYPLAINQDFPSAISSSILLEPGFRGGTKPEITKKQINSILGEELEGKLNGYDIKPFKINVLSLERIFVEKLFAIKSLFDKEILNSKTRHLYDVYMLINTAEIKALVKNTEKLKEILEDISIISNLYFPEEAGITLFSIKNCPVFNLDYEKIEELRQGYIKDKDLYFIDRPTFDIMIKEIRIFLDSL